MTEKEKYLKKVFRAYNNNKKRLKEISFNAVSGVDFSKQRTSTGIPKGNEHALVSYLDEKTAIEKQIELVERVLWFYRIEGKGRDEYIKLRYMKNMKCYRVEMELFVSHSTIMAWEKEIIKKAELCADMLGLWN